MRSHLFPFRTEKLSSLTPMVLRFSRGRVGSRLFKPDSLWSPAFLFGGGLLGPAFFVSSAFTIVSTPFSLDSFLRLLCRYSGISRAGFLLLGPGFSSSFCGGFRALSSSIRCVIPRERSERGNPIYLYSYHTAFAFPRCPAGGGRA